MSVNVNEDHLIREFKDDIEKLKEELNNEEVNQYLQWMILRELRFISNNTDSIDNKTVQ